VVDFGSLPFILELDLIINLKKTEGSHAKPTLSIHLELFSTCPQSSDVDKTAYKQNVIDVARWSEKCGYKGISGVYR
jgi:hypothetical protein